MARSIIKSKKGEEDSGRFFGVLGWILLGLLAIAAFSIIFWEITSKFLLQK